ncbi:MAG TPA: hypothetical protein VHM70_22030 [Polyangiaceae bacterium]|jgi:hypothetical protein|nr:hypothetical protein [Polyangiaceae bacterium]
MPARAHRILLILVALGHGAAALGLIALLPRGFPLFHPRFLINQALPGALLMLSLGTGTLVAVAPRAAVGLAVAYPAGWFGLALGCACVFPETGGYAAAFASVVGLACAGCWVANFRAFPARGRDVVLVAVVAGCIGAVISVCERAPPAHTSPLGDHPFELEAPSPGPYDWRRVSSSLGSELSIDTQTRRIEWTPGQLQFEVRPLLEFRSCSPDGFWTIFAPGHAAPPALRSMRRAGGLMLDDGASAALWLESPSHTELRVDAFVGLEAPVHSHLNSYATVTVRGHARLGLRFSPCPQALIEVVHADYPFGAPARFAYLDQYSNFRVVQATSAEKGPFATLAAGRLERDATLVVTLVELDEHPARVLGEIAVDDWAHQLSTALSPTAGFGVPENAIEFGLTSPSASSAAYIIWTLAATSIGRGWDTVTHAPGFYRNRMHLRVAE